MRATTLERVLSSPKITIGLPVHNGDQFLHAAITSIRSQTLSDLELVIADNASTDASMSIALRHASEDPRIRVLSSETNRGAAWNFNRLVDEARGRYFKWAAHDDVVAPTSLERCVAVMEADPSIVLCYGKAIDIDDAGDVLGSIRSYPYAGSHDPVDRVSTLLRVDSSCVEVFGLVRLDALVRTERIGAYTSSDRTLLFELALLGRFHELDEVLLSRRQHPGRSVRTTARDRNAWFDPERGRVFTFPRWRVMWELHRAVSRAPLGRAERLRVRAAVTRWAISRCDLLVREILAWGRYRLNPLSRRLLAVVRSASPTGAS